MSKLEYSQGGFLALVVALNDILVGPANHLGGDLRGEEKGLDVEMGLVVVHCHHLQ